MKNKCFFFHKWVIKYSYSAKMSGERVYNYFGAPSADVHVVFVECEKCGKIRCHITNGDRKVKVSAGYYARTIMGEYKNIFSTSSPEYQFLYKVGTSEI